MLASGLLAAVWEILDPPLHVTLLNTQIITGIFTSTIFHNQNVQSETLIPFLYTPCVVPKYHLLRTVQPGAYTNMLPILHYPFCALENGGTSECYTWQIVRLPIKMIENFPNTKFSICMTYERFTSDNDIIPIDAFP